MDLLYQICLTFVRKVEDLHILSKQDACIRDVKKASVDDEVSNACFVAFMNDQPYVAHTPTYDEYGVRVSPNTKGLSIGDIEIRESRSNIIVLTQHLTKGLVDMLRLFQPSHGNSVLAASQPPLYSLLLSAENPVTRAPITSPSGAARPFDTPSSHPAMPTNSPSMNSMNAMNTMNSMMATNTAYTSSVPPTTPSGGVAPTTTSPSFHGHASLLDESTALPEKFVMLAYRFVVGIFLCGTIYQEEESRTREYLEQIISCFTEVIRELPHGSARHVFSLALPKLYEVTQQRPIFISFFKTLITSSMSFKYSACVVIDFIVNHLEELGERQSHQPPLLMLFRIFCMQLNIMPNDEEIFKPYLRRLISESVQRMLTANYWGYYLDILYGCLNIFQHNTLNELTQELNKVIGQLINQLNHMINVTTDPHVRERALEIAYHITLNQNHMIKMISILLELCMKGLAGPDPLQRSGML